MKLLTSHPFTQEIYRWYLDRTAADILKMSYTQGTMLAEGTRAGRLRLKDASALMPQRNPCLVFDCAEDYAGCKCEAIPARALTPQEACSGCGVRSGRNACASDEKVCKRRGRMGGCTTSFTTGIGSKGFGELMLLQVYPSAELQGEYRRGHMYLQ